MKFTNLLAVIATLCLIAFAIEKTSSLIPFLALILVPFIGSSGMPAPVNESTTKNEDEEENN